MSAPANRFIERPACPACGGRERTLLFECPLVDEPIRSHLVEQYRAVGFIELSYLEGGIFRLLDCRACGLAYHGEVPGDELMGRIYDHWNDPARALAKQRADRDMDGRLRSARELMLADRRLRKSDEPLRVLDFGMGWGAWCLMARAFGCDVYGHETSPARLENARALGIAVIVAERLGEHTFDFINAEQVFEHLTDPYTSLLCLRQSLAPSGMIKISVPDGRDLKRRLAIGDWSAMQDSPHSLLLATPLQHINCFTRSSLVRMAHRAGLRPARLTIGDWWGANADRVDPGHLLGAVTRPLGRRFFAADTYVFFEAEDA